MDQLELTIQGNSGRIVLASRFRVSKNIENQSELDIATVLSQLSVTN